MNKIEQLLEELQFYRRDKNQLVVYYIEQRLNKSFDIYHKELLKSFNYITKNNDLKILKSMK